VLEVVTWWARCALDNGQGRPSSHQPFIHQIARSQPATSSSYNPNMQPPHFPDDKSRACSSSSKAPKISATRVPPTGPAAGEVPPSMRHTSLDDALNSSTWFEQQRYWEEVSNNTCNSRRLMCSLQATRAQTQLLACLHKQGVAKQAHQAIAKEHRKVRQRSVSPISPEQVSSQWQTLYKPSVGKMINMHATVPPRRRGSWSPHLPTYTPEVEASAMNLLALGSTSSTISNEDGGGRAGGTPAQWCCEDGKAKEAQPTFEKAKQEYPSMSPQQPNPPFRRRDIMSISALLN